MPEAKSDDATSDDNKVLTDSEVIQNFSKNLQKIALSERDSFAIAKLLTETLNITHCLILRHDIENATLEYESMYPKASDTTPKIYINTFNIPEDTELLKLVSGEVISYDTVPQDERLANFVEFVQESHVSLLPIISDTELIAIIAFYNSPSTPLPAKILHQIDILESSISLLLELIFQQADLSKYAHDIKRESEIFSRIDAELNDTIELNHVFTMMKDWALRFTHADAAALALFDDDTETLRIMSHYAFKDDKMKIGEELPKEQAGIMLRVARSGKAEIISNVTSDADYYALAIGMHTQMSVPIKREEKVIGILTLFSTKLNGFTDEHLDFTKRLASRAGVAVDNARLFTTSSIEREKLSNILRNISENVIVVSLDHRIELVNDAALLAFHLNMEDTYMGRLFTDVFSHAQLQIAYQDAVEGDDTVTSELDLPNGRSYHISIEYHADIGRIIIMQDITYFKETDRLKTELIATVSHDLKQPLSVMRGYLDLLKMTNEFDERSLGYTDNLNFAFSNMQRLIDELLDIARIEAGLILELEDVSINDVLNHSIRSNQQQADAKEITFHIDIPDVLPVISADPSRLEQIFNNLINNAVKYTPPEGTIKIRIEVKQTVMRIFIEDNGMGIGAEDQAKIFERFYRIRRPETDSIEGTGLGLAIVKSLTEAHDAKIDLKSILGKGSTFRVTLPLP